MIASASALQAMHCGWARTASGVYTMESASYVGWLDANVQDPRLATLPHGFVTAITSVHLDPAWAVAPGSAYGAAALVAAGSYLFTPYTNEIWLGSSATPYSTWRSDPRANKVVFVAGFAVAPPDIVAITVASVRHLMDSARAGSVQNMTQGGQSVTRGDLDSLLPASVRNALAPYVNWASRVG